MRIDAVDADAFGPFTQQRLELAPGMTVVHGPNEAGKSSWFAATWAGLCSIRRAKGRGTKEQRDFKQRHKPWEARGWRVGVEITLDNGQRLAIAHNLARGDTTVIDMKTGLALAVDDWEYEGAADGSTLLGLTRDSARATIFVAQADVLRVLESADELQVFLQRAAASTAMDTTVEDALASIAETQRSQVGRAHLSNRPLGQATRAVEEAEAAADATRDRHDELLRLLASRRQTSGELDAAEGAVTRLEMLVRWRDVLALDERLQTARSIRTQIDPLDDLPATADGEAVRAVTERLSAYRDRGDQPALPEGLSSEQLQQQIDGLPEMPSGDLEVAAPVAEARDAWLAAQAEAASHAESQVDAPDGSLDHHDADELRRFADVLTRPEPEHPDELEEQLAAAREARQQVTANHEAATAEWQERRDQYDAARADHDAALREYDQAVQRHEQERAAYERRVADVRNAASAADAHESTGRSLLVGGGVGLVFGIVLLVLGLVIPGVVVAVIGLGAAGVGLRGTMQTSPVATPPDVGQPPAPPRPPVPPDIADPGPAPAAPQAGSGVEELEAEFRHRQQLLADHREERQQVVASLRERGLTDDPTQLRDLARRVDGAEDAARRHERWQARAEELNTRVAEREATLRALLHQPVGDFDDDATLDDAWNRYVDECRQRAAQAEQAKRRDGLQETLEARLQVEARYRQQRQAWENAETKLEVAAQEIGITGDDADGLVNALVQWLEEQEQLRSQHEHRREQKARLDQVLGGQSLEELKAAVMQASEGLGDRPDAIPNDIEDQLEGARRRRDAILERGAGLGGKLDVSSGDAAHPAEAIEREAQARRELEDVEQLAAALQLAEQHLEAAKERVNSNIAPALTASIRPWLPRVTDGRYTDVAVSPDTLQVEVRGPDGVFRGADVLSHGTMEQAYLLLRIALADHLGAEGERAPLILDDVTVQSDAARTTALLDLLHELSVERQVVLFSQEDEVISWARHTLDDEGLIELPPPAVLRPRQ